MSSSFHGSQDEGRTSPPFLNKVVSIQKWLFSAISAPALWNGKPIPLESDSDFNPPVGGLILEILQCIPGIKPDGIGISSPAQSPGSSP